MKRVDSDEIFVEIANKKNTRLEANLNGAAAILSLQVIAGATLGARLHTLAARFGGAKVPFRGSTARNHIVMPDGSQCIKHITSIETLPLL